MQTISATIVALLATSSPEHFRTEQVDILNVDLQGIPGDRHYGFARPAGAREKWYPTGTPIRSGRQLSIVAVEELALIARAMDLPEVKPEWLGANILIEGVPDFTNIPLGTRLFFQHGASLVNEGDNAPCRFAGREVAQHAPVRAGLDLLFLKSAKNRRGIVASVERAGSIRPGSVRLKLPAQKHWQEGSLL